VGVVADGDHDGRRLGVPDHVRERLLQDPERRQVGAGGQRARLAVGAHRDIQTGRPSARDEPVEVGHARRRRGRDPLTGLAQRAQHRLYLHERILAGLLDRRQRRARLLGTFVHQFEGDAGLDVDHRDAVGQDVVQLSGDVQALLARSPARGLELGAPGLGGLASSHPTQLAAVADQLGDGAQREQPRGDAHHGYDAGRLLVVAERAAHPGRRHEPGGERRVRHQALAHQHDAAERHDQR